MNYEVVIKKNVLKGLRKLPLWIQKKFAVLAKDLQDTGPEQPAWQNYSKLSPTEYHCHLGRSWVACWRHDKQALSLRCIMLAVVKKPHTNQMLFEVKGEIPSDVLSYLEHTFGQDMEVFKGDEDTVNVFETDWYHEMQQQISPGEILRMYRENVDMTQAELAEKLGNLTRQKISDMEHNRRSISKEMARRLSHIFGVPVERFLYGI